MVVLTEKFRFIRDDVFLCPWIDTETGKQKLTLQKINLKTREIESEDRIDCIHTAITEISTEEFENYQNDADVQERLDKNTLNIRSSERLTEINLTPEEKFASFKSWTAGIAEAGMNAFHIQDEIDKNLNLMYPISSFIFRFMAKVDSDFIPEYLMKIERDCMFEGTRHESSFIANTIPILEMVWRNYCKDDLIRLEDIEIIKTLLSMDSSGKLFKSRLNFLFLRRLVEPDYNFKLTIDETIKIIEMVWKGLLYFDTIRLEEKKIIQAFITKDISGDLFNSSLNYQILRAIVIPEQKFKISEKEIVSFLEMVKVRALQYENKKILEALIKMNISGKLFNSNLNWQILRILAGSDNKFKISEENTSFTQYINLIFKSIDKPPLKLFLNKYSGYIQNSLGLSILSMPDDYHTVYNKLVELNLADLLFTEQIEERKTEIKSLAADALKNHWECDERKIGTKTCFCYDAENRIKLIDNDFFKNTFSCNICFYPKILCGRQMVLSTDRGDESLNDIISEEYCFDDNGEWTSPTISDAKDMPEVKLMVDALHILQDTGELDKDITRRITDVIDKKRIVTRKIQIKYLTEDLLRNQWECDKWVIGFKTDSETNFCHDADETYGEYTHYYYWNDGSSNTSLCPNILCDNEGCSLNDYGDYSLSTTIYRKYSRESSDGKWTLPAIFEIKDKPEIKLMVEALHMLYDTGKLEDDIVRRITDIINNEGP